MKQHLRQNIANKCGFTTTLNLGMHLEIPLVNKRINKNTFSYIVKRVEDKLSSWRANCLSMARRVVLAKSIIASLPVYAMQVNFIPIVTLHKIEKH